MLQVRTGASQYHTKDPALPRHFGQQSCRHYLTAAPASNHLYHIIKFLTCSLLITYTDISLLLAELTNKQHSYLFSYPRTTEFPIWNWNVTRGVAFVTGCCLISTRAQTSWYSTHQTAVIASEVDKTRCCIQCSFSISYFYSSKALGSISIWQTHKITVILTVHKRHCYCTAFLAAMLTLLLLPEHT